MRRTFLLGVWLGLHACSRQPAPPAPAPPPTPPVRVRETSERAAPTAQVVALEGRVEVRRGAQTEWNDVGVGDRLSTSDVLRTQKGARVELAVSAARVRVHASSELKVKELTETAIRAQLKGGLDSEVEGDKGQVAIEAEGGDAHVTSTGGRFSVTVQAKGTLAVATQTGAVKLSSSKGTVDVGAGQVSVAKPGAAPRKPVEPPKQVMLSVDIPKERVTNRRSLPVAGLVELGSRVMVQGELVDVDDAGRFQVDVPLEDGEQAIAVVAIDVMGRTKENVTKVERDARPPNVQVKETLW